jgi:hypothetical protein
MAVVQISRVQVRRGRKYSNAGIPQLSSGEMGWAIDTQQLYIGNGAVAEGAPYVGNTEVLTEHSNLLELIGQYQYKQNDPSIQTGPSSAQPVQRTLQERLDDVVSIASFIYDTDVSANDYTAAIQRALDQLYLNTDKGNPNSRVILTFEPGEYRITGPLRIPAFAILRGAGKDKTIIRQEGAFNLAYTVGDNSTPGVYPGIESLEEQYQPRLIEISGMTLEHTLSGYSILDLIATKNSIFKSVRFKGSWQLGDDLFAIDRALHMQAKSSLVTCENNIFDDCDFVGCSYGIYSDFNAKYNVFKNCLFNVLGSGVKFGDPTDNSSGKDTGPLFNKIINSKFIDIDQRGIFINQGRGNLSHNNIFIGVGNDGPSSSTAIYPVIEFTDTGNVSDNDYFERSFDLSTGNPDISLGISQAAFVSEYAGSLVGNHKYNRKVSTIFTATSIPLFRLGGYGSGQYKIHYIYRSTAINAVRRGTMYVTVDRINNQVLLTDDYDFNGNEVDAEKLTFSATFDDLTSDGIKETININYTNLTPGDNSTTSSFVFWYEAQS